jgi:hypothetical protein
MNGNGSAKRVAEVIASLPKPLRAELRLIFHGRRKDRRRSDLSNAEKLCLLRVRKVGVSFGLLEPIGHLKENNGNNAQRVLSDATRLIRRINRRQTQLASR